MSDKELLPMSGRVLDVIFKHESACYNDMTREGSDTWSYLRNLSDGEREMLTARHAQAHVWAQKAAAMYTNGAETGSRQKQSLPHLGADVLECFARAEHERLQASLRQGTNKYVKDGQYKFTEFTKEQREVAKLRYQEAHRNLEAVIKRYIP